ncbi:MAG: AAA family ATPase, partial [Jatrophihabitantaceae bacterium]
MPRRATPLVGRAGELAQLEQLLAGSTERGAIVSGDAGVGKTRLLAEVLDRAERASIRCLAGHCLDFGEASLPYLPFSEAFGRLAETDPALVEQLLTRFGPIGRLLPPGPGSALSRSGEDPARLDRAGLYDSVQSGLEAIAEDQPVLLLIEDVHWADQATRDLIGFLLARLRSNRLSLLVSYRTDDLHRRHPLRRALAEWSRLPRVRRVHLDPLSATEVRSLVTAIRPSGLSEDELGRIVERAAGNAFYAEELASAAGQDRQAGAGDGLPGELAELLLIRLDRLSELAGELVRLAAVAGGRIGHEQLVELADRPDRPDRAGAAAELEAALREAVDEHVLEPVDIGYTFRHALLSEAVYDDLLPGERVRLHAAFARLLAGQPGSANAAQLARHARRSNDLAGAFAASILAGEQAMDLAAPQEAMRHFETALELLGSVPAPADRDWTQLVLAAADAAGDAGHPYRALAIVRDALERPPVGLADLDHARLLLGLANRSLLVDADNDAAAATTAALQLVPAQPPSQLRARLAALHAHASVALGRDVDGARWAQEAIELSGQLGQPEAAADARTTLGLIERRSGDPDAAAQQLRAVAEQAQAGGELTIELRSRYTLATLHHEQGQLPAALVAFQTAANRARETGRQWAAYGIEARALAGMVQYELGDWDGALRTVDVAGQAAPATAAGLLTAVGLAVRAGRGETEALSLLPMLRQRWQSEGLVGALAAGPAIELLA